MRVRGNVVAAAVFGTLGGTVYGQAITSVEPAVQTRSGRLVIRGSGFGSAGTVTIGGVPAIVTTWSATKVHAYVPENAGLGGGSVVVMPQGGSPSNSFGVTVTARGGGSGRVLWKFQADDPYIRSQPTVGPDGTIYAGGAHGHLYALAPDGTLRWVRNGAGGFRPPAVGPDGTVYAAGLGGLITALDPADGSTIWSFPAPAGTGTMFIGPNVGPDGNIYAVTEEEPTLGTNFGAFSLTPQGTLRWNTSGGYNFRHFPYAWEVVFQGDPQGVLYFDTGMGFPGEGNHGLHALRLGNGQELWKIYGLGQASVDAAGNVYTLGAVNNNNVGSFTPTGATRWLLPYVTQPGSNLAVSKPDGASFLPSNSGFRGINPDGTVRFDVGFFPFNIEWPQVRPDGGLIVAGANKLGPGDFVYGLDPQTGALEWEVALDVINGIGAVPSWIGEFSADGNVHYFPTSGDNWSDTPWCFLYAIDSSDGGAGACYANCDSSTAAPVLNVADFTCFLSRFAAGDAWANCDQSTAAPVLNVADFTCFLSGFAAGCP